MKFKIIKLAAAVCLAAALLLASTAPSLAEGSPAPAEAEALGSAEIKSRGEVIYASLAPEGGVRGVYVVNSFEIAKAGEITDHGDYTAVKNLTDTAPITQSGSAVTAHAAGETFFYQGNMAKTELPWLFDISYRLDGAELSAKELAGRSGKLEISVKTEQNAAVNPVFFENYMLQITVTLDTEKCCDIEALGAAVAAAGKDKMLVYTVMPGTEAKIALSAAVKDFEMAGIDISAVPFSFDVTLPDMSGLTDGFSELAGAVSDLAEGAKKLAEGAAELKTGASGLENGSSGVKAGLSELSGSSGRLIQASSQIGAALNQIASALDGASGTAGLGELAQLPAGLAQLSGGLKAVSGGLSELKNGFAPAYAALDKAIKNIPEGTISKEDLAALYAGTDQSRHALLDALAASYAAGQTVKGTYNQVKAAFDAVGGTIETLSASIDEIAASLDEIARRAGGALSGIGEAEGLFGGLAELSKSYAAFHTGLKGYTDGVDGLSSGYEAFHSGLSAFGGGAGELSTGAAELGEGAAQLREETDKLPVAVQEEIDAMLDKYSGAEFVPVSFASAENAKTDIVQFVLKLDGIEKPKEQSAAETTVKKQTFWNRLAALFTGK